MALSRPGSSVWRLPLKPHHGLSHLDVAGARLDGIFLDWIDMQVERRPFQPKGQFRMRKIFASVVAANQKAVTHKSSSDTMAIVFRLS